MHTPGFTMHRPSRGLIFWGGMFAVSLGGANALLRHLNEPAAYLAAVWPVIAGALAAAEIIRAVRRLDELQRKIHLEAVALAFAGTFLILLLHPVLHGAGLVPQLGPIPIALLMGALALAGYAIAWRRYR